MFQSPIVIFCRKIETHAGLKIGRSGNNIDNRLVNEMIKADFCVNDQVDTFGGIGRILGKVCVIRVTRYLVYVGSGSITK